MSEFLCLPSCQEIEDAEMLLAKKGLHSNTLPIDNSTIFLKLDCQLPGGSYKIRGIEYFASHYLNHAHPIKILSAGNLALAAAIRLKENNVHCIAIVPEDISHIKYQRLQSAGATIQKKSFSHLWELVQKHEIRQSPHFLHPFNKNLLTGYATIVLEMKKAGFNQGTLVIPYGLGGLATALAHAIEIFNLDIQLYLCEIAGFSPFKRALCAHYPVAGSKLKSFIEAMGTPIVITDVFHFLKERIAGVIEVTEEEVKQEINTAFHRYNLRIEGAAGASLAGARKLHSKNNIFTLLTGSNISDEIFQSIITN